MYVYIYIYIHTHTHTHIRYDEMFIRNWRLDLNFMPSVIPSARLDGKYRTLNSLFPKWNTILP